MIGRGSNPTAAYDNLIDQACTRAGVDRATLTRNPDHTVPTTTTVTISTARAGPRRCEDV